MEEIIVITNGTLGQLLQSKLLKDPNPLLLKEEAFLVIGTPTKENIQPIIKALLDISKIKGTFTYNDKVDGPEQNQFKREIR